MSDEENKVVEISHRDLTLMEQLDQWLKKLIFPGKVEDFIEEVSADTFGEEIHRELFLYTDENRYYINAIERSDGENYIGCNVSARKTRAGEDWTRGNDLPDGPFNKETWNRIIYAIVNYELVKLTPFKKPDTIPEDVA
ncbi:hypothetical protein KAR91_11510 [Candidatus Pacearchaeota archaeon]|nr:hypothetical protein [Candidatus Pacearchaeota archaeon]